MIAKLVILLNGQIVFRRDNVMLRQPFGVDIDPPRAVVHRLTPNFLAFLAQEPVDENFRGIGVWRVF